MSVLNLIGVGPGDPELLTLKATRLIAAAAVVAYPHKPGEASLAFDIAKSHVSPRAVRLPVDIPMSVEPGPAQAAYDAIAETLAAHVTAGRSVAWLCEGDPLFYGSAIYLLDRLAGRIRVEVVPGVTSLTAAAAAAARPLATRNQIL
ncbi:MAG: SAM-dependent methyltransferase, partial [Cucumibacter sp.]